MIFSERDPFSRKAWQEFLNQSDFLIKNNLTIADVVQAISDWKIQSIKLIEEELKKVSHKCPRCDSPLWLLPLNISPSTQTGDDSKSVWLCKRCHYEQFSIKTVEEELNG